MAKGGRARAYLAVASIVALALAFHVVRTAAVADREARPRLASALWPGHPSVQTDRLLLAIAGAAARGEAAPPGARSEAREIARKAPLSPDPFVIEGAIAASEGRGAAAERLLLAARGRDPRSRGARYLLAERYLATGRIAAGLIEMQSLVGLQSRGGEVLGPALVAYARSPGAIPQLRAFFRRNPTSEPAILNVLATDAANADLVLALASNVRDPVPDWRVNLLAALVHDRQYGRAYAIWSRLAGVRPSGGLFNPAFAALPAPPPFNWQFPQSVSGVAEPNGEGGLDVLHYGRAKAVLATQLLVLPPGDYRMAMRVESAGKDGLPRWVVRCADSNQVIAQIPLRAGAVGGAFRVSDGCKAQWLELESVPDEASRTGELTIRGLRLDREGSAR